MALVMTPAVAAPADVPGPAPVKAAASTSVQQTLPWYRRTELAAAAAATLIVIAGYFISVAIWSGLHREPLRVSADFGLFGLLYIVAQATERLLEPFSAFVMATKGMKEELESRLAHAMNAPSDPDALQAAANARERLEQMQAARTYILWAAATLVGMLASSLLGIYLLAAITIAGEPPVPFDILVTGLVIGGGTKPLHDLITRIESAKQKARDPLT